MAQVTPAEIMNIGAGMEKIYQETVDDLLINIAHHFDVTGWERTRFWEIKKLSELGALTEESVGIIAKHTGKAPEEIRAEFQLVAQKACKDIDPQLKKAAATGFLQNPGTDITTSPAMRAMLTEYEAQAVNKLNMVNTTMLESTRAAFINTVNDVTRTETQLNEAQGILNTEAGAAATHVKTHAQATKSALQKLSNTGLTGYVDRAGRQWTPEAYVAMDIRTTAHNVAVNSVRTREQEYGTDLFQVSAHAAARPLCYPWQNKILSWGPTGGTFTDGDGNKREYQSINETSYGEPAGLFGINCTHFPMVVIPGLTVPHDMPEQDPEENARAYAESQEQRALERDIRAAKRDLEIAKAAGLPTDAEAERVKQAQANMREFIKDTGRTRQYNREQIVTPKAAQQAPTPQSAETTRNIGGLNVKVSNGKAWPHGSKGEIDVTTYETPEGTRFNFPKNMDPEKQTLTPEQLLTAWGRVPQGLRNTIQKTVNVVDWENPGDAYWKKHYANFTQSYATGGEEMTFYKWEMPHDDEYLVRTIAHDGGHYIDQTNSRNGVWYSEQEKWTDAMANDMITSGMFSPTEYGENSNTEDFAESLAEYVTNNSDFVRKFPNRAAILSLIGI